MPFDQVHEQNNKIIKGTGGASNFPNQQDDSALLRWEMCGPEIARMVSEFEDSAKANTTSDESNASRHHEDNESFRAAFVKDVITVYENIICNPFTLEKLTSISNTSVTFDDSVFLEIKSVQTIGSNQAKQFILDRFINGTVPLNEKITKNNFSLLNQTKSKAGEKGPFKLNPSFLSKLRSGADYRLTVATELFEGEPFGIPVSLAVNENMMYHGTKSSIKDRMQLCHKPDIETSSRSSLIIEMSPIIHKFSGINVDTYHDFAYVLYRYCLILASGFDRLDVIWDRYFKQSLKEQTREQRGATGARCIISDDQPLPKNFKDTVLHHSENKNDLALYLATKFISLHGNHPTLLVSTF